MNSVFTSPVLRDLGWSMLLIAGMGPAVLGWLVGLPFILQQVLGIGVAWNSGPDPAWPFFLAYLAGGAGFYVVFWSTRCRHVGWTTGQRWWVFGLSLTGIAGFLGVHVSMPGAGLLAIGLPAIVAGGCHVVRVWRMRPPIIASAANCPPQQAH